MKDVLQGKWVKFNTKEMEKAAAEGEESGGVPAPDPSLDAKTQKKLAGALREVIAREVKFRTAGGEVRHQAHAPPRPLPHPGHRAVRPAPSAGEGPAAGHGTADGQGSRGRPQHQGDG
ncbi:hypothetical protein LT493_23840 [Streptomyces tricolor]|nr:hypothetical protein [Streptomyces tricolor]